MKKLLLISAGNIDRGGVQIFLLEWIKAIRALDQQYKITWYCPGIVQDQTFKECFEKYNVQIITGNLPGGNMCKNAKYRKDIRKILEDDKYDIVHVNTGVILGVLVAIQEAARAGVIIRVSHSHNEFVNDSLIQKIYHQLMRKIILDKATCYAACSNAAGRWMYGEKALTSNKWRFVANRIDIQKFSFNKNIREEFRNKLGVSDELVLGAVGALCDVKNHIFLIAVMEKMKLLDLKFKLIIIGDGELRLKLQEEIIAKKLQDVVKLIGLSECVECWLQAMDIFVMPSHHEGYPITTVEAQASGLPCLLSNTITKETKILEKVKYLPINQGVDVWVDSILHMKPNTLEERASANEKVRNAGFDNAFLYQSIKDLYGL